MNIYLPQNDWREFLYKELVRDNVSNLIFYLKQQMDRGVKIYPPLEKWFRAFELCPFENLKVVLLGQDPYHKIEQANGLAFSVDDNIKLPPSLKNIYKEIENDLSIKMNFNNGNLETWAKQGVLLMNTSLSVEEGKPLSHSKLGWENFTNNIIKKISKERNNIVFILWGKNAQDKKDLINKKKHLILEAAHPSPFSAYRGFFGCNHFSKTNKYLSSQNKSPIEWIQK